MGMSHLRKSDTDRTAVVSREALRRLNRALESTPELSTVDVVVESSEDRISLPREVAVILQKILVNSAAGRAVGVIPLRAELTTQQAADLLSVSRPHIIKLMNEGILPGHKVGTHRRVYAADVQDYLHQRDIDQRAAADELAGLSDEMGLYE